ncbi:MAG TPA: hypothetical protein VNP73_09360 [Actinomycetota bacterium]|nr:hypothetical protein [Actinomycetota bacterium]
MRKIGFLVGFGAGYVLGAKAGTERYDQLKRLYENLASSPQFRQATNKAKGAAQSGFESAKDLATEGVDKIKSRGDDRPSGLSVAPPPS